MAGKVKLSRQGNRIRVDFPYDDRDVTNIKDVSGRSFSKGPSGRDPHWTVPLDLETCRKLRRIFGQRLVVGADVRDWAWQVRNGRDMLGEISQAESAPLPNLEASQEHGALVDALNSRPFQRAGARFVADSPCPLIADDQGLGKTLQTIAGIYEGGYATGPMLVATPKTAIENTWGRELRRWQNLPVWLVKKQHADYRRKIISDFMNEEGPRWLVINPTMLQLQSTFDACEEHNDGSHMKVKRECELCEESEYLPFPQLLEISWHAIVLDEIHRTEFAVTNPQTKTARGFRTLHIAPGGKRIAISGTPMRGRPADLFGTLRWLTEGTVFSGEYANRWRWQERYVVSVANPYTHTGIEFTRQLRPEMEQELQDSIRPFLLRRLKSQVATDLPEKQRVDVWCDLIGKQEKQYTTLRDQGCIRLGQEEHYADGVLAELTRARQLATAAVSRITRDGVAHDAKASGKVEALVERLEEIGIFEKKQDPTPETKKVVVFSQWAEVIKPLVKLLDWYREGCVDMLTGDTSSQQRQNLVRQFQQDDGPRVLCMTTQAGGVSITLDRADTVHFLDETWEPTDMTQAEDRLHRVSRTERTKQPVTVYTYRTRSTIDEYVWETGITKAELQKKILDNRHEVL